MKKKLLTTLLAGFMVLGVGIPCFASEISTLSEEGVQIMASKSLKSFATDAQQKGPKKEELNREERSNPLNAIGGYRADQIGNEHKFYSTEYYDNTTFVYGTPKYDDSGTLTGGNTIWNIPGDKDIEMCEVTWGDNWYVEGVKVYLKNAVVRNENGDLVDYVPQTPLEIENNGYYAGIAWSKIGMDESKFPQREKYEAHFNELHPNRTFKQSTFRQDGNFLFTQFDLPDDVVAASGIVLVDLANDLYKNNVFGEKLYFDSVYQSSPGGFDLDAISAYACP